MRDGKMLLDRAWGIADVERSRFENGSLGQPPGSAKRQMFAESETTFFVKTSPTEVTLEKDGKGNVVGVIVKSGPRPEMKLKKVK